MNQGKICVSICGKTADDTFAYLESASAADLIEVRFDCLEPDEIRPTIDRLIEVDKEILVTFRPVEEGGRRPLTRSERLEFWKVVSATLKGTDFLVDHEFDLDFPSYLAPERTMISMHDFGSPGHDLQQRLEAIAGSTGHMKKIAVAVEDASDAVVVWKLLENDTTDVIPIAMGEGGKWTRILGLAHGAPITYASLGEGNKTAPGQISFTDLRDVFRVKELDHDTKVYAVLAGDTSYSLSPYMHNAAFGKARLNSVFIPLQVRDLDNFMRRMVNRDTREVELNFKGFSVTNPHKQAIMSYLDEVDETAEKIGAVNTVEVEDGKLVGFNTDAPGFIAPLKRLYGDLRGARTVVVGSGGAARACVYALATEGADVIVAARDESRATALGDEFGVKSCKLETAGSRLTTDILVNATPLGTRGPSENESVATSEELDGVKLVYDLVYNPGETRLIREAKAAGVRTLGGIEMLIAQGAQQFLIWTDTPAPVAEMTDAVVGRLNKTYAA